MKKQIYATLSALTLLTAGSALAQSQTLQADIPFEFHAGEAVMPAGHYTIQPQAMPNVLVLRCYERNASAMIVTDGIKANKAPDKGSLVFNRHGEAYFLSTVWTPGYSDGRSLRKTPKESEYQNAGVPVEHVSVALATK